MTLDLSARRGTDAGTSRAGGIHYPCFDGLRAVAALTVVGVHTSFVSGFTTKNPGWGRYTSRLEIGVEVFFVISGFLLYRPFAVDHFGGKQAPRAGKFWVRRLKRIIPAYWLAFVIATYVLKADSGGPGWKGPLIFLSFGQIYFPSYILHGLSQAWSLCIEMTFYLMIPFYAALLARKRRAAGAQLRVELWGVLALTAVSFAWRIPILPAAYRASQTAALTHSHNGYLVEVMPNWLPGYLDQFALGMLLAVVSAWLGSDSSRTGARQAGAALQTWLWHPALPWVSWSLAAVSFWAVSNIGLPLTPVTASPLGPSLARQALYGLFAFFLVLPAVFGVQEKGLVRRVLQWRALALVGIVSYGVYLWHEAWIHMYLVWSRDHLFDIHWLVLTGAVTALAIASAALSYRLLERPILRYGRRSDTGGETRRLRRAVSEGRVAALIGARS